MRCPQYCPQYSCNFFVIKTFKDSNLRERAILFPLKTNAMALEDQQFHVIWRWIVHKISWVVIRSYWLSFHLRKYYLINNQAGSSKTAPRILIFQLPWVQNLHFIWNPLLPKPNGWHNNSFLGHLFNIFDWSSKTQPLIQNGGLGNKQFLHSADSRVSKQQL